MDIVCVGGGPAGLYFSILMKKLDPAHRVTVLERNPQDATFGWGVVFSDETLSHFGDADPETLAAIKQSFVWWNDIHIFQGGKKTVSTGHGFCGMSRLKLLNILQERARSLGVELKFGHDVDGGKELEGRDLVVACDGVNSRLRATHAQHFQPSLDWRMCRFTWLGLDRALPAFTFIFRENLHGLFQVHAYPFDANRSTFIVECREEVWRRARLDKASEQDTVAYMEELFGDHLGGARLLSNNSIWRAFPTVRNTHWHHGNMVLMGDAAHTAHFSIGSGTKLAMEDAIALRDAFATHGTKDVPATLQAYEVARHGEVDRIQKAAQTSLEWFENSARFMKQDPVEFSFNLMTRSKRITYDNLKLRDPALVDAATRQFTGDASTVPLFKPFKLRNLTLPNRVVMSPMCMYSARDGMPDDWQLVHLGSRAVGGAGLIISEDTAISPEGRITPGCAGIWTDEQAHAWKRVTDFVHTRSASRIALQLGHAGRKASCHVPWNGGAPLTPGQGGWPVMGPSALPFDAASPMPKEMDRTDMEKVVVDFTAAARRAVDAGFDMLELHMAHGYLLSTFISALSNTRKDAYGGSLQNRLRFPLEVLDAVRAVWPKERPLSVRISATEWADGGLSDGDRVELARTLHTHGADILDCSAGSVVEQEQPVYGRMFQVHLSDQIRNEAGVPTMTVGNIQDADQCNTILAAGRADLCVLARAHLMDPYFTLHAATKYGQDLETWPVQYLAVKPGKKKG